ncbi:MAG: hypothetical protein NC221_03545 [Duncaniella sp.]|nr:hypothetical protein [Duncaniella sp.]
MDHFNAALEAWKALASFRSTRNRLKNYTYGRQWDDITQTPDGNITTEGDGLRLYGRRPQTNNLIRPLVKSVVGRFRYNISQEGDIDNDYLRGVYEQNQLDELDSRALEEFLISGGVIQRVGWESLPDKEGVEILNVNPNNFFVNRFLDPRGRDIRLVGMLHDMPIERVKLALGAGNPAKCKKIEEVYAHCADMQFLSMSVIGKPGFEVSFFEADDRRLCRLIEVWSYDFSTDAEGMPDAHWHCRYFAPDGTLLDDTRSPFIHSSHPFVVKLYPLTDGEVHSFIEDVVDQQKHINQLITMIDSILSYSAKGVLLFPTDAFVDGMDIHSAARLWNHPGGVIPVNAKARTLPQEVHTTGGTEGASNLLDIEMKLFRQMSGVSTAMQGLTPESTSSASLYDSQVYNAAISLLDIFDTFKSFRSSRDRLILYTLR